MCGRIKRKQYSVVKIGVISLRLVATVVIGNMHIRIACICMCFKVKKQVLFGIVLELFINTNAQYLLVTLVIDTRMLIHQKSPKHKLSSVPSDLGDN